MSVSGKLPTYPSPNLTFFPKREVRVDVRFGKGWVSSFPETYIDPTERRQLGGGHTAVHPRSQGHVFFN